MPRGKKSSPAVKRPVGRPSDYDPAYCAQVEALGAEGMGIEEMAPTIGVAGTTFRRWMEQHEDFRLSVEYGLELCRKWWLAKAREKIISTKHGWINDKIWSLNMMNRFGWNKKEDITSKGEQIAGVDAVIAALDASRKKHAPTSSSQQGGAGRAADVQAADRRSAAV